MLFLVWKTCAALGGKLDTDVNKTQITYATKVPPAVHH